MINLDSLDLNQKTELCHIMNKYGSDKGNGWHNYTIIYTELFKNIKDNHLNIFEVGLGTNNIDVPSNMGVNGKPGASLFGWREYFLNSNIYGADIDKRILFQDERISTYFVDQLDSNLIKKMWQKIDKKFDIMIDDGLHTFEANIKFFENSYENLNEGGIYIIEDILIDKDLDKMKKYFESKNYKYQILNIPISRNKFDNVLVIIYK
jgi:hypothetical protein